MTNKAPQRNSLTSSWKISPILDMVAKVEKHFERAKTQSLVLSCLLRLGPSRNPGPPAARGQPEDSNFKLVSTLPVGRWTPAKAPTPTPSLCRVGCASALPPAPIISNPSSSPTSGRHWPRARVRFAGPGGAVQVPVTCGRLGPWERKDGPL